MTDYETIRYEAVEDHIVRIVLNRPDKRNAQNHQMTNDLNRAIRMTEALEYGTVGINDAMISAVQAPFGGMKESGLGRELGHEGLEAYLETKAVSFRLRDS